MTRVGGGLRNSLSRASLGIPPGCSGPFPVGSGKLLRMDPGCTPAVSTPELISGLLKSLLLSSAAEWRRGNQAGDKYAKKIFPSSEYCDVLWCVCKEKPCRPRWSALGKCLVFLVSITLPAPSFRAPGYLAWTLSWWNSEAVVLRGNLQKRNIPPPYTSSILPSDFLWGWV